MEELRAKEVLTKHQIRLKDIIVANGFQNILRNCQIKSLISTPVVQNLLDGWVNNPLEDRVYKLLDSLRNSLGYSPSESVDDFLCVLYLQCKQRDRKAIRGIAEEFGFPLENFSALIRESALHPTPPEPATNTTSTTTTTTTNEPLVRNSPGLQNNQTTVPTASTTGGHSCRNLIILVSLILAVLAVVYNSQLSHYLLNNTPAQPNGDKTSIVPLDSPTPTPVEPPTYQQVLGILSDLPLTGKLKTFCINLGLKIARCEEIVDNRTIMHNYEAQRHELLKLWRVSKEWTWIDFIMALDRTEYCSIARSLAMKYSVRYVPERCDI